MNPSPVATTYGPTFVGCVIAALFYGTTCAQTCRYYLLSHGDCQLLKIAVYFLWLLDTLHMATVFSSVYFYIISNRGKLVIGSAALWTDGALIIISNISNFLVRCILVSRLFRLSDKNGMCMFKRLRVVLFTVLGVVTVVAAVFGVLFGIVFATTPPGRTHHTLHWPLYVGLSSEAAADLAITATLCIYFSHLRETVKTSFPLMNKLIVYTICSGIIPSIIALLCLITFILYPYTFLYIGLFFPLSKATLNSMLAILNVRKRLQYILPAKKLQMIQKTLDCLENESASLEKEAVFISELPLS